MASVHVLIVEDNPSQARALKLMLESFPGDLFTTEIATTLHSAIARIHRGGVKAMLLDLALPDARGVDVVKQISEADPELGPIIYTGWDIEGIEQQLSDAGAGEIIQKPSTPAKIAESLLYSVVHRKETKDKNLLEQALSKIGREMEIVRGGDSGQYRFPPIPRKEKQ